MGRRKKEDSVSEFKNKASTIIDFINYLTVEKRKWEDLTEEDKKAFQPFILNRFLSMDLYMCEAINQLQQYTIGMEKDKVWRVYYELLPKQKFYLKYIKAKDLEGIPEKDIQLLQKYFKIDENNSIDYFKVLNRTESGKKELELIKHAFKYEK